MKIFRFLPGKEWKAVAPMIWGRGSENVKGREIVYCITARQRTDCEGIIYIGKQGGSDRLKNFVQSYLALCKLMDDVPNMSSIGLREFFNKTVPGGKYGPTFKATALGKNLPQIIALWNSFGAGRLNTVFKNLDFEFWALTSKDADKDEKLAIDAYEEKYGIKPPANSQ